MALINKKAVCQEIKKDAYFYGLLFCYIVFCVLTSTSFSILMSILFGGTIILKIINIIRVKKGTLKDKSEVLFQKKEYILHSYVLIFSGLFTSYLFDFSMPSLCVLAMLSAVAIVYYFIMRRRVKT